MGNPVVHFEVIGKDAATLHAFYGAMFGWQIDANNPMNYGMVSREQNCTPDGIGIGGGVAGYPDMSPHVTFYVGVEDVEAALAQAETLGGTRVMGPETVGDMVELGQFKDPEGNLIGVVKPLQPPQ